MEIARRETLQSQRSALSSLLNDGVIGEDIYVQLVSEIDAALTITVNNWPEMIRQQTGLHPSINRLISAVIQEQDLENSLSVLTNLGFSVTHLPSSGGFLSRRSAPRRAGV